MSSRRPSVAIVVLNYNGLADTVRCLDSLRAIDYAELLVIVVDNGSAEDPWPAIEGRVPRLLYIRNEINLGYAGGNNRGIAAALERGAELVLILNNDTIVAPSIVSALVDVFKRHPEIAICGPVINYLDQPDHVMTDGVRFNVGPGTEFFSRLPVPAGTPSPAVAVDIVNGCCMMVRSDVFRSVGLFDERMFIVHEEADFCLRARRLRLTAAVLGETLVWHKGSSAFERSGRRIQRYYDTRNLYYLLQRHAGRVGDSRSWTGSWWPYVKYAFYRYAIEVETGKSAAARAVVEGLWDALSGETGIYRERARPGAAIIQAAFDVRRQLAAVVH